MYQNAGMAKLVDALDLGSSGATHKSSSLFTRTKNQIFLFNPHRPYQAPLTHRHSRAGGNPVPRRDKRTHRHTCAGGNPVSRRVIVIH